jgi:hypothetical protein
MPPLPFPLPLSATPLQVGLVTAAVLAGWLVLLAALTLTTRTYGVRPGPENRVLGPESPAVVDLITGNWRLCDEAASATLLDLAARRFVAIEEIGPELSLVRMRRDVDRAALTPYEQMVFDHVAELSRDGVVATGALAEGGRHLGSWEKRFRRNVIGEARRLGLSQPRWRPLHHVVLTVTAVVPAAMVGLLVLVLPAHDGDEDPGFGAALGGAVVAWAALTSLVEKLNGERGTTAGAAVASRWLGVREHLAAGRFAELPAAAVTIWGRPLAYAAALGLAHRAVTSLPVSTPSDDTRAWSDYGGMWHVVEVRYRGRGPWGRLAWGRRAVAGIFTAVVAGWFTFLVLFVALLVLGAVLDRPSELAMPTARIAGLVTGSVLLVLALTDAVAKKTVEGQVVRLRRYRRRSGGDTPTYQHWVAVDEGGGRRSVHAFGTDEATWFRLTEGDLVRARVGRRLGWMYGVDVLTPSRLRRQRPDRDKDLPDAAEIASGPGGSDGDR